MFFDRKFHFFGMIKKSVFGLCLAIGFACMFGLASLDFSVAYADVEQDGQQAATEQATTSTGEGDAEYAAGEIIVVYDDEGSGYSPAAVSTLASRLDKQGVSVFETLVDASQSNGTMVLADVENNASVEEAIEAAEQVEGVAYAQPNYIYHLLDEADSVQNGNATQNGDATQNGNATQNGQMTLLTRPLSGSASGGLSDSTFGSRHVLASVDDPYVAPTSDYKTYQYYLYGDELYDQYGVKGSNVLDAWDYAQSDHKSTIAILDTGVNLNHEDLKDNILTDYAYDAYSGKQLVASGSFNGDYYGHGTHVAGICAGVANNGIGIAGTSYNANILPIKVADNTTSAEIYTSAILGGFNYLFGLIDDGSVENVRVTNMSFGGYYSYSSEKTLVDRARNDYGIVNVCAGGNGSSYGTPYTQASYPSDYDSCFAVTALDYDGTNMVWSDYNKYKDISAPGSYLYSTYNSNSSSYTTMSGTSMASPLVAGVAALLFSIDPSASADEVIEAIEETATPVPNDAYDRANKSGSHGAIDAAAAVEYFAKDRTHVSITVPDDFGSLICTQSVELGVTVSGIDEDELGNITWTWSVTDGQDVARVDDNGVVTGLSAGTATIRVEGKLVDPPDDLQDLDLSAERDIKVVDITMPSTITATAEQGDAVHITWTTGDAAVAYRVMRAELGSTEYSDIATVTPDADNAAPGNTMTYDDTTAEAMVLYNYYIVPLGELDGAYVEGLPSDTVSGCRMERVATLTSQLEMANVTATYNTIENSYTDTVIIVGENDAMTSTVVSGLAGVYKAPVYVSSSDLSDDTVDALVALNSNRALSRILVVGDEDAVSDEALIQISALCPTATVSRYGTSTPTKTAETLYALTPTSYGKTAFIVSGDSTCAEDTWALASYASAAKAPIFATNDSGILSTTTRSYLTNGGFSRAVIIGDTDCVSADVDTQVQRCGVTCERIAGKNPYDTARLLVEDGYATGTYTGNSYYVAPAATDTCLVGGVYAGSFSCPLIVIDDNAEDVLLAIRQSDMSASITFVDVFSALSSEEADRVERYIEGDDIEPIIYGEPVAHSITVKTQEGGNVSASAAEAYEGDVVTLTIAPNENYEIGMVAVVDTDGNDISDVVGLDATGDDTYEFVMPAEDVIITATWVEVIPEPVIHNIEIIGSDNVKVSVNPTEAAEGEEITIMVTPDGNYTVDSVSVIDVEGNDVKVTAGDDNIYTFIMPDDNVMVEVKVSEVEPIPTAHEITIDPVDHASVSVNKTEAIADDTVTITVILEEGYEITDVVVKDASGIKLEVTASDNNTYTFTMPDSDVTVEVQVSEQPTPEKPTITVEPGESGNYGSVVVESDAQPGDTVIITVTPDEGYVCDDVTVTGVDTGKNYPVWRIDAATTAIKTLAAESIRYSFEMPDEDVIVTVTWKEETTEITSDMFDVDTSYAIYDGAAITKTITSDLKEGTDYTVTYANNTAPGEATITITGTGNYTGTLTYTFKIIHYFEDVGATKDGSNEWYFDAVYGMVDLGAITGYNETTFGVGDSMSRAQLVTIMWRYCEPEEYAAYDEPNAKDTTGLPDAQDGMYYTGAVNWAYANGVITGNQQPDGTYTLNADDPVTFDQMVTILARYVLGGTQAAADYPQTALNSGSFTDKDAVEEWAAGSMSWAIANSVVTGNDNHDGTWTLSPLENVARERAVTVLYRSIEDGLLVMSK